MDRYVAALRARQVSTRAPGTGAAALTTVHTYVHTRLYLVALSRAHSNISLCLNRRRSCMRRRVDHGDTNHFLDDRRAVALLQDLPHPFRAAGRNVPCLQLWTYLLLHLQRERCAHKLEGGRCNGLECILLSDLRGTTSFQQIFLQSCETNPERKAWVRGYRKFTCLLYLQLKCTPPRIVRSFSLKKLNAVLL